MGAFSTISKKAVASDGEKAHCSLWIVGMVRQLIESVLNYVSPAQKQTLVEKFTEHFAKRSINLGLRDLKDNDPRSFIDILEPWCLVEEPSKVEPIILTIILEYIKNPVLEKRLIAINELKGLVESCQRKLTKYYDMGKIKRTLEEKGFIETVFGAIYHNEVAKRASYVIQNQIADGITQPVFDQIWILADTRVLEQKRTIYQIVGEIARNQPLEGLDLIIAEVIKSKPSEYTESFFILVRDLTEVSCQIGSTQLGRSPMSNSSKSQKKKSQFEGFGLAFLWGITAKPEPQLSTDLIHCSCRILGQLFEMSCFRDERERYLGEAIKFLKSAPSNLIGFLLAESVIRSFPISSSFGVSFEQALGKLSNEKEIVELTITSLELYFKDKRTRINEEKKGVSSPAADEGLTRFNQDQEIQKRLDFLDYLNSKVAKNIEISPEHFKRIWKAMVSEESNPKELSENVSFLRNWINNGSELKKYGFFDNIIKIFDELIRHEGAHWTLEHFEFIETIFRRTNEFYGSIVSNRKYIKVREFSKLQGVNIFWGIVEVSENSQVQEKCSGVLINIYSRSHEDSVAKYVERWSKFFEKITNSIEKSVQMSKSQGSLNKKSHLNMLRRFLKEIRGQKFKIIGTDTPAEPENNIISFSVVVNYANLTARKEEVRVPANMTVFGFKEEIARIFEIQTLDFDITLTHGLRNPYTFRWSDEEEFLVSTVEGYKDKNREKDIEINLRKPALCAGMTESINRMVKSIADSGLIDKTIIESLCSEREELVEEAWGLYETLPVTLNMASKVDCKGKESEADWTKELTEPSFRKIKYFLKIMEHQMKTDPIEWSAKFIQSNGLFALIKIICSSDWSWIQIPFDIGCLDSLYSILNQVSGVLPELERAKLFTPFVSQLISAGLNSLTHILGLFKQNPDFSKPTSVFEFIFTNLVSVTRTSPENIKTILDFPGLDSLILFYLTELSSVEVAQSFSVAFQSFITRMRELDSESFLKHFAQMIFGENLMKAVKSGSKSFIYFDVAVHLLENLTKGILESTNLEFKSTLSGLSMLLTKTKFEFNAEEERRINSLLRFINGIAKKFPDILSKLPNFSDLVSFVYNQILFPFAEGSNFLSSPNARREGYILLAQILSCDFSNFEKFSDQLNKLYSEVTWRSGSSVDWQLEPPVEVKRDKFTGLKNLGCTCYINSMTQQLFMIEEFRDFLIEVDNPDLARTPQHENVLFQFQKVLTKLKYSESNFIDPRDFCGSLRDIEGKPINVFEQMDVDEFFNNLVEKMETTLKVTGDHKIIPRTFGGVECNEMIGREECSHTSERPQEFLALTLGVKGVKEIGDSLKEMIKGETLSGSNAYFCDKCEKKVTATRRVCIKKLPNVLIIVLKRFDFDYEHMIKFKVNDYCKFPLDLDMEPYTQAYLKRKETEAENSGKLESKEDSEPYPDPEYFRYSLKGTVIHLGTAESGHYYSYIRDKTQWYIFNDTVVSPFDVKDLPEEAFGGEELGSEKALNKIKNRSAYVLFYERSTLFDDEGNKISSLRSNIPFHPNPYVKNMFDAEKTKQQIKMTLLDDNLGLFLHDMLKEFLKSRSTKDKINEEGVSKDNLELIKSVVKYFLIVVLRQRQKKLSQLLPLLREVLAIPGRVSDWFLNEFKSADLLKEFLLEPKDDEIRLSICGLLANSMKSGSVGLKTVSEIEDSLLGKFIKSVIQLLTDTKEPKIVHYLYKIIYSFAELGPTFCGYLAHIKFHEFALVTIGKLDAIAYFDPQKIQTAIVEEDRLDNKREPEKDSLLRSLAKETPTQGKVLSLEDLFRQKRENNEFSRQTHQMSWLILTLLTILFHSDCELIAPEAVEPGASEKIHLGLKGNLLTIIASAPFLVQLIGEAKSKKAANSVGEFALKCIEKNPKTADEFFKAIETGILEKDDEMRPFLVCMKKMLQTNSPNAPALVKNHNF